MKKPRAAHMRVSNRTYHSEVMRGKKLREFWAARGYEVKTYVGLDNDGNYIMKSDTINGMPKEMARDPAVNRQIRSGRYHV